MSRPQAASPTSVISTRGSFEVATLPQDADRVTVQVRGEMDLATADLLDAVLENHLGFGRRHIRLDVSRLTFLDCAGLRVIVRAHNRCLAACGALVLAGVGPRTARLLGITHLDEALLLADRVDAPPSTGGPWRRRRSVRTRSTRRWG
jgi:anti-sigma B factor antagonist